MSKKDTLIVIPGFAGDIQTWQRFQKIAETFFDVKIIELPCFGSNICTTKAWNFDEYVSFVVNKIKELRVTDPIILAHSLGGNIAVEVSLNKDIAIKKLVLLSPPLLKPTSIIRRLLLGIIKIIGPIFFLVPLIESIPTIIRKILTCQITKRTFIKTRTFKNLINKEFNKQLKNLKVPTLLIWGKLDFFVPISTGKRIHKSMPNSELKIINTGGHILHAYKPDELFTLIKDFI